MGWTFGQMTELMKFLPHFFISSNTSLFCFSQPSDFFLSIVLYIFLFFFLFFYGFFF